MARGLKTVTAWCMAHDLAECVMMMVTRSLSSFPSLLSHYDELPPHCGVIVDSRAQKLEALLDTLTLTLTTLHPGFVALPAPFYGFPPRSKITYYSTGSVVARTFIRWLAKPIAFLPLYSRHLTSPPDYPWSRRTNRVPPFFSRSTYGHLMLTPSDSR